MQSRADLKARLQAVGLIKEEAYKHTLTELAIDVAFHPSGEKREPFAKARLERRGQAKL